MRHTPVILLADRSQSHIDEIALKLERGLSEYVKWVSDLSIASMAVAIGGDGTLIRHGRQCAQANVPLVGVNSGRLGFLAKFNAETLIEHRDVVFTPSPNMIQSLLIEVQVNDELPQIAMNEIVITAGHPFRILELGVSINGSPAPHIRADGIILSTPLGSTAHNASAGGPIVDPEANSMVLTPIAAHSLAVRPIVLHGNADVDIEIVEANEGTSLIIDGAVQCPLQTGTRVRVHRSSQALSIVLNPTYTYWNALVDKLHWAALPG